MAHGRFLKEPALRVPTAYIDFPKEISAARRARLAAAHVFANIQRWTTKDRGGHFAALEQPVALAEDVRAFFRTLR